MLTAGSIFDSHKRRAVQPLLYARSVSILLETAFLSAPLPWWPVRPGDRSLQA